MKTIKEHLQELPEPARTKALANMWWEDEDTRQEHARDALYQAFNWSKSPEGYKYWREVCNLLPPDKEYNVKKYLLTQKCHPPIKFNLIENFGYIEVSQFVGNVPAPGEKERIIFFGVEDIDHIIKVLTEFRNSDK